VSDSRYSKDATFKAIDLILSINVTGYTIPKCKTIEECRAFIDALSMVDSPATFGLHPNADIT